MLCTNIKSVSPTYGEAKLFCPCTTFRLLSTLIFSRRQSMLAGILQTNQCIQVKSQSGIAS
nr:hypothetical protein [Clostridium estertheticum]